MNRTILITGASSGIGLGLKEYFVNKGDKVIDISLGGEYDCDITDTKALDEVFAKLQNEKIDILINNAGAVELVPEEQIRLQFDINFFGLINITKRALPLMKDDGKIINISSTCALFPLPFRAYYCASKAAVSMITDGLRMELSKYTHIQVAAICPGEIKTNFTKNRVKMFETNERYKGTISGSAHFIDKHEHKRMPIEKAIKKITSFIEKKKLKPQKIIGKQKILYFVKKFLPKSAWIKITQKMYIREYNEGAK